jgi:hypothetical protein
MMSTTQQLTLKVEELERLVKRAEPAAFLVPPRLLRRVIKHHRQIGGLSLLVPHRKGYVIDRESLLRCVTPQELGAAPDAELPPYLYLLVRPDPDRLARYSVDQALVKHWRILFHLRIDHHLERQLETGTLTPALVRQRIRRLGLTEFDEIKAVLRQEDYLLPPETAEHVYAEFVAVYLTLRRFDPALVSHYFPALRDLGAVDALVAEDVDVEGIYKATRLAGAPEPGVLPPRITQLDGLLGLPPEAFRLAPAPEIGDRTVRGMLARADKADARGNTVRAAILRTRAAEGANLTLAGARTELKHLSDRLKNALELSDADAESWRQALLPLLVRSARGSWSQEARFLYDLQSVCVDSERGIYAADLVGWVMSLGKLPVKRQLPGHQGVAIVRHLRRAMGRMRYVILTYAERQRLTRLLAHAVEHRERLMRERFRPLIAGALDEVGLRPHNVAEEIGRAKMIEELLDRVVEFGHFNIGNLRDAISRNQLKLPDLKGPGELVLGDPLIHLNRKLAVVLDGVYRRGEIYMRLLHRLSSVAFGTALGRLLVLFLILPFGLAVFVMITPGILVEEVEKLAQLVGVMEKPPPEPKTKKLVLEPAVDAPPEDDDDEHDGDPAAGRGQAHQGGHSKGTTLYYAERRARHAQAKTGHRHQFPLPNWWGVLGFGIFFLLLFHVGSFRTRFFYGVGKVGRGLQTVFIHGPVWLVHLPALQAILQNRFWLMFRRCVFWPAVMATTGWLIASWYDLELPALAGIAGICFVVGIVLLNTRLGHDVEEAVTDWLLRVWVWLSIDFIPGLLRLIMDVSRRCLEAVEQVLYTVNEWLRFRSGENQVVIWIKAVLALIWFWVTYVIRFAINLLIEPQVNPIKHFPVVTVSHKVCLPMTPVLRDALIAQFGLARPDALALAGGIITGIPGIFGFMVWELKENWKLYGSNRPKNLKPVLIGSHGETMLRLLRPGFHSGTVPKLYKKLRRAQRHGQQRTVRKVMAALHHVAESIAHFVERELLALLRQSKGWGGLAVELGHVRLATNRVLAELRCPSLGEEPLVFSIDHQNGWLLAGVLEPGWLPRLNAEQRQTLAAALAGLYKMAGVHLTREQIDESLPTTTFAFDITDSGLVVWTGADGAHDAVYDLSAGPELQPKPLNGALPPGMPVLDTTRLLFTNVPLEWQDWVRTWEGDQAHADRRQLAFALLPTAKV